REALPVLQLRELRVELFELIGEMNRQGRSRSEFLIHSATQSRGHSAVACSQRTVRLAQQSADLVQRTRFRLAPLSLGLALLCLFPGSLCCGFGRGLLFLLTSTARQGCLVSGDQLARSLC